MVFKCTVTTKHCCISVFSCYILLYFVLYHLLWLLCLLNGNTDKCDPESFAVLLSQLNELSSQSETNGISQFLQLKKLNRELHETSDKPKKKSHAKHKLYHKYDGILKQYILDKKNEFNIEANNINIKLGIVIGQRRGGTTMFNARLASHPQIANAGEMLQKYYQNNCSHFSFLTHSYSYSLINNNKNDHCSIESLYQYLTFKYKLYIDKVFKKYSNYNVDISSINEQNNYIRYSNFAITPKVQIEQIPESLYVGVIEYILMNDIVLINMYRSATIASFWSYQADSIERVQVFKKYKNMNQIFRRKRNDISYKKISNQINIDENLAKYYVNTIDSKRFQFLNLLYFVSNNYNNKRDNTNYNYNYNVSFITVYYEQLIGFYSSIYWQMVLKFLDVTQDDKLLSISLKREHPQPCWTKIQNWQQAKRELKGTKSYFACQSLFS